MDYKQIRDRIQKRYSLDMATANEVTSDLLNNEFKRGKVKTIDGAMRYLDHLEELGA